MDTYRGGGFAALLNVNPCTVRRWISRGLVAYVRLPGGEHRIPRDALTAIFFRLRAIFLPILPIV